ncbi:hypothetical protein [Cellulomonas sp. PhB150]|uniref:hypothetical protein n=1 Tax=Cellulomonas sp. PhB150 TaxID=2485188 RepID=UPI000F4704FC|nr:hypothetical protein [Cellulomonas sp. PhB150]ROS31643.1 hypothetical protein EDF34_1306 [Cellulomonas sp. PhB150]
MTHPTDPVDPMHRALSDAEASDEAAGYTVPVALVRSRVRRRRAVRAGGAAGVACLAVVAVVVAVPSFLSRTPAAGPPATPPPGVNADWPAQFDRCGKKFATVLPDVGRATLTTSDGTLDEANQAIVLVTTTTGPAGVDEGWVYGTELSAVDDDGTIIGVQEGPSVPAVDDVDDYYAGTDFASVPFPIKDHAKIPFVSCGQYPDGSGALALETGTYHLWATQTIGYRQGSESVVARATVEVPIVVPLPARPATAEDYFACGLPVARLTEARPDAAGLVLEANTPAAGWGSTAPAWSVTVGASDGRTISARSGAAGNLALVDSSDTVVGFVTAGRSPLREFEVGPDATTTLDGPTLVTSCDGTDLTGDYEAWPFLVATLESSTLADGSVASTPTTPVVVVADRRDLTFGP